jgi:ATP-dependent Zn protease
MITLVVQNAAITINKTIITQKKTKNLHGSLNVKYVHRHRQLRRNLLSKMQYKTVKRKSDARALLGFLFSCIFLLLFILRWVVLFYFGLYVI